MLRARRPLACRSGRGRCGPPALADARATTGAIGYIGSARFIWRKVTEAAPSFIMVLNSGNKKA
jgi:hypothetical protein